MSHYASDIRISGRIRNVLSTTVCARKRLKNIQGERRTIGPQGNEIII